jgi:Mn-dependent DtxR family transcriptional regulator
VETPGVTQGELAKHLGLTPPTVDWYMKRYTEIGLINYQKDGRFVKYSIEGDDKEIARLIRSFYPALWHRLFHRLIELFLDLAATS